MNSPKLQRLTTNLITSCVLHPGIRRDHQLIARALHELCVAAALALWPPVVMAGLGGGLLDARRFFAWCGWG